MVITSATANFTLKSPSKNEFNFCSIDFFPSHSSLTYKQSKIRDSLHQLKIFCFVFISDFDFLSVGNELNLFSINWRFHNKELFKYIRPINWRFFEIF